MDERIDNDELGLDQAIDASRTSSVGNDTGSVEDTVDRLRSFTTSGPPVEQARVWRSIEERLDHTPQHRPWWSPRWVRQPELGSVSRKFATGGAIAVLAVTIGVGSLLTTSGRASAAFLENVEALAALTTAAADDGVIDSDESAAIAALVEELRAEASHGSLGEIDPVELAGAVQLLRAIENTLDDHEHDDDGIGEVTRAVAAVLDHGEHEDDDHDEDEGEHRDDDASYTQAEIDASLAALAQLELDIEQLKLDADDALAAFLAELAARESAIGTAQAEALLQVAAIPDLPPLEGLTDEEIKDLLAQIGLTGIEFDGEHGDDDDEDGDHHDGDRREDDDHEDGDHEDGERRDDDDHSDHALDGSEADRLASALVGRFFESPGGTGSLFRELDHSFSDIEHEAKELSEPFDEEFRYSREDAKALLRDLDSYLSLLEAEARLASAAYQAAVDDAESTVRAALDAKIGDLLSALDQLDGDHDGDRDDDDDHDDDDDRDEEDDDDEHHSDDDRDGEHGDREGGD